MKTVVVKSQKELDALPMKFDTFTVIEIRSLANTKIQVTVNRESSRVEAWGSSRVVALDSSRVVARESSRVVARDSSRVEARESSRVEAWGSSRVVAWGYSRVVARESSRVVAWGYSRVVARESSRVEAWGSSRVVAWESSRVVAYEYSMLMVLSAAVLVKHLADWSSATLRAKVKIEKKDDTATVINAPENLNISFETWLERGYVVADGITRKLISRKKKGSIEVFTVENFLDRKEEFVVKKGDQFSHGDTVEDAIKSLRYKLSDRDTSRFKQWKLTDSVSLDDAIQAYRAITGACEYGVRSFCESRKIPDKLTVQDVVELTKGSYGNQRFAAFFGGEK
jgi:hypothetical protein